MLKMLRRSKYACKIQHSMLIMVSFIPVDFPVIIPLKHNYEISRSLLISTYILLSM